MWFTELRQEKRLQGRTTARQLPKTSQQPEILLNEQGFPEKQETDASVFSESDGELSLKPRISGPTHSATSHVADVSLFFPYHVVPVRFEDQYRLPAQHY